LKPTFIFRWWWRTARKTIRKSTEIRCSCRSVQILLWLEFVIDMLICCCILIICLLGYSRVCLGVHPQCPPYGVSMVNSNFWYLNRYIKMCRTKYVDSCWVNSVCSSSLYLLLFVVSKWLVIQNWNFLLIVLL
jgi:hypothetical protein